ncbi:hypothetical protein [Cellvibrio mixtus]|uniref:hypothetical protein n=1 Tax=Cellvibrio mixtus TaxID=39650 RepID=UPI000ADBC625|nr:hypothetical protein [Cellvibrio mixtus]
MTLYLVLHFASVRYLPAACREAIIEQLEDMELKALVEKREARLGRKFTKVNIDDL